MAMGLIDAEANSAFDLFNGPVMRVLVVRVAEDEHVMIVNTHHIATDGWSIDIMETEISVAYGSFAGGGEPDLAPLEVQYSDYARWQREWLDGDGGAERDRQLAYWRGQLGGAPDVLDLPTDRPRPAVQSHAGGAVPLEIPSQLVARLEKTAAARRRRRAPGHRGARAPARARWRPGAGA